MFSKFHRVTGGLGKHGGMLAAWLATGCMALANPFPGFVSGIGYANFGQNVHPQGLGPVLTARAPMAHTVALLPDGTVAAWGLDNSGSTVVPSALSGVVQADAGNGFSVVLRGDGTVVAWGANGAGQATVPSGLDGVVAIDAGMDHTLALKSDGTVVAWGDNTYGQTAVPVGLADIRGVAAGRYNSVVLHADGTVQAWGGGYADELYPPSGITDVVSISSTWEHTVVLREDGTVVAWGRNDYGQATVPAGLDRVVAVSAGGFHSLALRDDGSVVSWGVQDARSAMPADLGIVVDISAGYEHSTYVLASGPVRLPLQRPTLRPVLFTGFGWPVLGADETGGTPNRPAVTIKRGSVVPVTFELTQGGVPVLSGIHTLSVTWLGRSEEEEGEVENELDLRKDGGLVPTSGVNGVYPFSVSGSSWRVNLATKRLQKGTYRLTANLEDGSTHSAWIRID